MDRVLSSWLHVALMAACALALDACRSAQVPDHGPHLALHVAPLNLPGIGVACYDIAVTNQPGGAGDTVWSRGNPALAWRDGNPATPNDTRTLCSTDFGNGPGGDIAYVGACDAGNNTNGPAGVSQQQNSVLLWIDGLYDQQSPPQPLEATGQVWRNPCAYDEGKPLHGACLLEAACTENADTPVTFNLTIMRDADQGFFDTGVNFEDIFCSVKVDCSRSTPTGEQPIELLTSPVDGQRVPTVVLGFACTGGPATDTYLYLSEYLDCGDAVIPLPIGGPTGNVYSASVPGPPPVLQLATYRGLEGLANPDGTPLDKIYFNTALALDFSALPGACSLVATLSASDHRFLPSFTSPANTIYPVVLVDVPLVAAADATGYACVRNPLGTTPADGVWTSYTRADETVLFDYDAHEVAGAVVVDTRADLTLDMFAVMAGMHAISDHYSIVVTTGQRAPFVMLGQSPNFTLQGGILSRLTRTEP